MKSSSLQRELLGCEGVKGRLGHQAGPKTRWEILTPVQEVIISKEQMKSQDEG